MECNPYEHKEAFTAWQISTHRPPATGGIVEEGMLTFVDHPDFPFLSHPKDFCSSPVFIASAGTSDMGHMVHEPPDDQSQSGLMRDNLLQSVSLRLVPS